MKKIKLWIDTDMGNDDIMALAMLAQYPQIKLQAISLVNGVSSVKKGLLNLQSILNFLNLKVALFTDSQIINYPYSLKFPSQDIDRAEELTLLNNLAIKKVKQVKNQDLTKLLGTLDDNSTLLALGPLTNLATLVQKDFTLFKQKIGQIVLMGGGIYQGNVPPLRVAEYNIALDPISADIVFNSRIPVTMIGIDLAIQVPCSPGLVDDLVPVTKCSQILKEILVNNKSDFEYMYDPLAASYLINPRLFSNFLRGGISVIKNGVYSGKTVYMAEGQVSIPLKTKASGFNDLILSLSKGIA